MNVGVIEPRGLIRQALCALLASNARRQVVLSAENALESLEHIKKVSLDVLLIDPGVDNADLSTVAQLHRLFPRLKLLLLSDTSDEELQLRAVQAGASGCISKDSGPEVLERALEVLEQGQLWMNDGLAKLMMGRLIATSGRLGARIRDLTPREWEILSLLASGRRNKEIAGKLVISENTVKTHVATIFRKLNVTSRTGAALYFFQWGQGGSDSPQLPTLEARAALKAADAV